MYGAHNRPFNTEHRYTVDKVTGCWLWNGSLTSDGYGRATDGEGRARLAHVLFWEQRNGPRELGIELDHLCRNRRCCNPDHLEPVSKTENLRRGDGTTITRFTAAVIRVLSDLGFGISAIIDITGATRSIVSKLRSNLPHRQRWKDITSEVAIKMIEDAEKIVPVGNTIHARTLDPKHQSAAGLVVPEHMLARNVAVVLAVGHGVEGVRVGNVIIFPVRHNWVHNLPNNEILIKEGCVFAVIGGLESEAEHHGLPADYGMDRVI